MLPGKKYTPEDLAALLRHRIWWLLLPFAVLSAGTAITAHVLPDLYRSETLVLVVPQRVPESYVRSTVTTRIEDRLQSISQQILSRTRLERIIQEFNLYPAERRMGIMEDIVQRMKTQHIKVEVQKGDVFSISYIGRDPRTVMQVTDRLASFFIEESLRDRQALAEGTDQFLEAQLKEARERLIDHEKKLEQFRQRNAGALPSQVESNLQAASSIQVQIQAVLQSIDRGQERRITLERQLGELQSQTESSAAAAAASAGPVTVGADAQPPTTGSAVEQLGAAQTALESARLRLRPEHPDVQRLQRLIRDLTAKVEAEALQVPVSAAATPVPTSPADAARLRRIAEIRDELDKIDSEIAAMRKEEERLRVTGSAFQARAQSAPARESELTELMRDYGPLQGLYSGLLSKKEDARIAANLERRQIGEQFRLLDPARLPERPFSPDRQMITMVGVMAGLGLGLSLVALLEYRDRSLKTDDEVALVLNLPILAVVPRMASDKDRRRERRRTLVKNLGFSATVFVCVVIVVYSFIR
jgi:polysaccharide chain length determinant protein (PEP-CTERM system associated)